MSNYLVPFLILAGVLGWVLAITLLVVLFGKGTALADRIEIDGEQPDDLGHRKPSHTNRLYREN